MRISREPSPLQITMDKKKPENEEYLIYLGSLIRNDARFTREIKYSIATVKQLSTGRRHFSQSNWT
jgi:hypothetical protein